MAIRNPSPFPFICDLLMIIKYNMEIQKDSKYLGTLSILSVSLAKLQSTRYLVKTILDVYERMFWDAINI